MSGTSIEYMNVGAKKGETWSSWIGCTRVSPGCDHCWAGREEDGRFRHLGRCLRPGEHISRVMSYQERDYLAENAPPAWSGPYFFRGPVYQGDAVLQRPLRWRKPRQVFVGSRCDIFHDDIAFEKLDRLWAVMALRPQHTYQLLTKRPKRMLEYLDDPIRRGFLVFEAAKEFGRFPIEKGVEFDVERMPPWPLRNVMLGVTVEDQQRADERIPLLLQCPAALRYVSYEPALGAVDLERWLFANDACDDGAKTPSGRIGWVICGGESGKGARPMDVLWARLARDQCAEAGIPYFFKQFGEWLPHDQGCSSWWDDNMRVAKPMHVWPDETCSFRVGKKKAGRILDGKLHDAMPEVPDA